MRQSLALAAILRKHVKIEKVRGRRANPGLQRQHLTGIELVARMSRARLVGAELKSPCVEYIPGPGLAPFSDPLIADTRSAGATALLLQISLPCLLLSPSLEPLSLVLRGGTNADAAPQCDYIELVLLPTLAARLQLAPSLRVVRRGFFPKGRGEIQVTAQPVRSLPAFSIVERGAVQSVRIRAFVAGHPLQSAVEMAKAAKRVLRGFYPDLPPSAFSVETLLDPPERAFGVGGGCICVATTDAGCVLAGSQVLAAGMGAAQCGREAATVLYGNLEKRGAVDEYLQDQLIVYMALAHGRSQILTGEITLHTETALHFAREIAHVDAQVEQQEDGTFLITIEGMGYENDQMGKVAPVSLAYPEKSSSYDKTNHNNNNNNRNQQQKKRPTGGRRK